MKALATLLLTLAPVAWIVWAAEPTAPSTNSVAVVPVTASTNAAASAGTQVESTDTKLFTTINSDLLDFDYQKKVATFEGNVNAIDPQLKLNCKKMVVYFADKNNEVVKVEAFDDVHLYHEGKEATGDKAVFTRDKGIVIISGNKARLRDEKGNWIASGGDGIIYNINTKQMKVDKPTLELIPSSTSSVTSPTPTAKP